MKAASSRQGAAHRRAVHGEASRQGPTDRDQQIRGLQTGPAHRGPAFQPTGTCRPLAQAWQELEGNMHFLHNSVSHFRAALETTGS